MKSILNPKHFPYFVAIVQAVLFSIAGDRQFEFLGWLVGLGVGVSINYSIALASSRIFNVAKNRKLQSYFSLICLVSLSPVIICSTLGWTLANFSWSIANDMSIILVGAIVGGGLMGEQGEQGKPKQAKRKAAKVAPVVAKVKRNRITDEELLEYLAEHKGETKEATALHFGVTHQAIGQRVKKLYAIKQDVK